MGAEVIDFAARRRAREIAENEERRPLTPYERSKKRVEALEREQKAREEAEAEAGAKPRQRGEVSKGGRGKKGGRIDAAREAGVSDGGSRRAEKHVDAAERSWTARELHARMLARIGHESEPAA